MRRFQDKTKAMFVRFTIIPMITLCLVLGGGLLIFVYINTQNGINNSSQVALEQIEGILSDYQDELNTLSSDEIIQQYILTKNNSSEVLEKFYTFNSTQDVKSTFTLYNLQEKILSSAKTDDFFPTYLSQLVKKKMLMNPDELILESRFLKHDSFSVGHAIKDKNNTVIGYMMYSLDDAGLQDFLMLFQTNALVVTDDFDNILVTRENYLKDFLGKIKTRQEYTRTVSIDNIKYYQSIKASDTFNLKVYALVKYPPYGEYAILYILLISLIVTMMYFMISFLANKVAATNSQSVNILVSSLENAKLGQLHGLVDIQTGDEFEYLAQKYNEMLTQLNQVILNNEELTHIQQQNEIKFLQSQFNPHFLFNMLETIKYTMLQDVDEAKDIIIMLSKLLRYSIDQSTFSTKLQTDMEHVEAYLQLHKYRYKTRLQFTIDIAPHLYEEEIPRLLIQPIVENAIKYGYMTKMDVHISIKVYEKNNIICFEIHDDGDGMKEQTLFDIQKNLIGDEGTKIGIGLILIHRKIKILYGIEYGVQIESNSENGTTVLVTLPKGEKWNV